MIFNFNKEAQDKTLLGPRVFNLPPHIDFVRGFVDGLLSKFDSQVLNSSPELLSQVTILASNKVLARNIEEFLVKRNYFVLPKIIELGNISDAFYEWPIKSSFKRRPASEFRVISRLNKFLFLNKLIEEIQEEDDQKFSQILTFDLAESLIRLVEELNINDLSSKDLKKLTDEDLPKHLQLNLGMLHKVLERYEVMLYQEKLIDENVKYLVEVCDLIDAWNLSPHYKPIIVVGSTGSQLATAKLMEAVTRLPQGFVVLPGLDPYLSERGWKSLTADHPQYGFLGLCKTWGLDGFNRDKVIKAPTWFESPLDMKTKGKKKIRSHLISLLMRPGSVTDEWRVEGQLIADKLLLAMGAVTLIEANNSREEAAAIGLRIKEAVNKGSTVALITPSKLLARRVTVALNRWNITPNNSLGVSLARTDFGLFFRQTAQVLESAFQFDHVIGLLQNRYCGGDYIWHDKNTSIIQESFSKSNKPFLDVIDDVWLQEQDEEFNNWYNWLSEIFNEANFAGKKNFLSNTFSYHQKFIQRLMGGYVPKKTDGRDPHETKSLAETYQPDQVMKVLDNELKDSSKSGKFEFWTYKKLVENLLAYTPYNPADENKRSDVFIWGTLESRTQNADICILAGLNEGIWPGFHKDNFWLNRSMRAVLGLDLLERKVGLSAHDFQQGAMAKTLVLSRSLRDTNVPTVPSRWLARLENLLGGLGKEGKKCLSDIRSRGQMLTKLVQEFYSSDFLVNGLPDELRVKARRPAPVPPITARPNRLSVTEIETLIKNPYAIYAKKVLNLKKSKNISYTPDLRNKGLLLHTTLEEFISENIDILPDEKKSCDLLRDKFKLILTRTKIPIEVKNVWIAQFNKRVDSIVALERERRLSGKPVALEISAKYLVELKGNNEFLITAKADRIDSGTSGVTIYDYKTGQITKKKLEKFSPQLDIEALMLVSGSFGKAFEGANVELSLVGLGSDSKQYKKVVTTFDLKLWQEALIDIIERMKLELSPFVARLIPPNQNTFSDDYEHLSRFGEWNDNDDLKEIMVRIVSEESTRP